MVLKRGHLGGFDMGRWRRMEKISWSDQVRNEEVLHRVKEDRNPTNNKKKEGYLDWSHITYKLPSETRYGIKDRGQDRRDGKMRK
jgi:hypothetical protein